MKALLPGRRELMARAALSIDRPAPGQLARGELGWQLPASLPQPCRGQPGLQSLPAFAPLWLNEVQADNLTGITNSAGERGGWLELYNPTTNLVSLSNLCLSVTYTNLAQWTFPADAVIAPNEFKVVFADGQLALSSSNELHTGFALSSGAGALVLSQLDTNGQSRVLDYLNYTNLGPNHSYGSFPDGQSFVRQEFFYATPGSSNDGGKPIPVAINEWMAGNTHTSPTPSVASTTTGSNFTTMAATPWISPVVI